MKRRTTLELDEELLAAARRALGLSTMRETIEEALRRAVQQAAGEHDARTQRQRAYLGRLDEYADRDVMLSEAMWR